MLKCQLLPSKINIQNLLDGIPGNLNTFKKEIRDHLSDERTGSAMSFWLKDLELHSRQKRQGTEIKTYKLEQKLTSRKVTD